MPKSLKPHKVSLEQKLERKIDSTIDEKIDSLVKWRKKYPKITMIPTASEETLKEYARTKDEYKQIQEEYEKMQKYYTYIRCRKSQNKLKEEQILKCKEGYIGGVLGYPTEIEELAKKYGITERDVDYIVTKYGTLDNFYEMYKKGNIFAEIDKKLERKIIKDVIDIDGNSNKGYEELWRKIVGYDKIEKIFFSSEELKKVIEELDEREKFVINEKFGLKDGTMPKGLETIGKEMGVILSRVRQIKDEAIRKLYRITNKDRYCYDSYYKDGLITDEEIKQIEEIKTNIQLQNGDLSENLEKLKLKNEEIEKKVEERQEKKKIEQIKQRIKKGQPLIIEELEEFSYEDLLKIGLEPELVNRISLAIEKNEIKIEQLELSPRAYNCLKKACINSFYDLSNMTERELSQVRNLGKKSFDEIIAKISEYGISLKEEGKIEQPKIIRKRSMEKNKGN